MNHLDTNTIIDYVMINEINEETKKLASDVCSHIRECEECRETVNAYLNVYGNLIGESERDAVKRRLIEEAIDDFLNNIREFETHQEFEEYQSSEF